MGNICEWCGSPQVKRLNRHTGEPFIGCSAWPKCKWSLTGRMDDEHDKEEREQPVGPGGGGFGGDTDNGFCGCDDFGDAYD